MRNIKKLVEEYTAKFSNTKSGADFKASEAQQLKKLTEERCIEYQALTTNEQIFCAFDVTWSAAYMAGYKKALNDAKKGTKE